MLAGTVLDTSNTENRSVFDSLFINHKNPVMTLRGHSRRMPALGDLERRVLEHLWAAGVACAQSTHGQLASERELSLSTVQSTLERLVRKQLLTREKAGRAFRYRPAVSRDHLTASLVAELVASLRQPAAASGFVDVAQAVDETTLQALEAWIAQQRAGGSLE